MTEAYVCKQLAQGALDSVAAGIRTRDPVDRRSRSLTTRPPSLSVSRITQEVVNEFQTLSKPTERIQTQHQVLPTGIIGMKCGSCRWYTEKDVTSGGAASSSAASWTNWAVSGMTSLTSKIYRGNREAAQRPVRVPVTSAADAVKEGLLQVCSSL